MFLKVSQVYSFFNHLASLKPSQMEASRSATETRASGERERSERQRYSGMATEYPATVPGKEAALLRQGTANARGDEQESSQAGLV